MDPAILTIDVGTGSARAGLVDFNGNVRALHAVPHKTHYPQHSWVEQEPDGAARILWTGENYAYIGRCGILQKEGVASRMFR